MAPTLALNPRTPCLHPFGALARHAVGSTAGDLHHRQHLPAPVALERAASRAIRSAFPALNGGDATLREIVAAWAEFFPGSVTREVKDGIAPALTSRARMRYDTDPALADALATLLIGKRISRWEDSSIVVFEREVDAEIRRVGDTVLSLSTAADSAALAIYMAQTYPQIPTEYVFCDTDAELPETYDYLDRLEALLGKPIHRINALDYMSVTRKPNRKAFDFVLNEMYSGFLPSLPARWCTPKLKIEPFERYVGNDTTFSYLGIRSDEDREGYTLKKPPVFSDRPNIIPIYALKDDGTDLVAVRQILESSGNRLSRLLPLALSLGLLFLLLSTTRRVAGPPSHSSKSIRVRKEVREAERLKEVYMGTGAYVIRGRGDRPTISDALNRRGLGLRDMSYLMRMTLSKQHTDLPFR